MINASESGWKLDFGQKEDVSPKQHRNTRCWQLRASLFSPVNVNKHLRERKIYSDRSRRVRKGDLYLDTGRSWVKTRGANLGQGQKEKVNLGQDFG